MLNEHMKKVILAYFVAKYSFNSCPINSREETVWLTLLGMAREKLYSVCSSYSEFVTIVRHLDYLADRKQWPILYAHIEGVNHSIMRKSKKV